jgi:hypothetical protein
MQMRQLAQEAAGAMKNAMAKNKKEEGPSDPNGPIPFKPANDHSFREYNP